MVPRVQRLNLHWSRQVNHSFRYKSRIRPFPYFSSPNSFFQSTLSTSSINKAETIQFTSLHHKIRTVLSNSTAPPPPLPPTLSSPSSSSSSSSSPSKAIKSTVQSRAYSPQQFYKNRILDQYVSQPVNTITLRQLVVFGRNLTEDRLLKSGNYVRTELPIRLAHRIRDFQNLPFIVGTNPHIAMVYDLYWSAFEKLRKFPTITNLDENDEYCDTVKGLLKEHLVVIPQLALGISECSQHLHPDQLDKFMNTMLRSRISRRVLAEQQIALTENWNDPGYVYGQDGHDGYIGIVSTQCKSGEIVQRCANMTRNVCRTIYNVEPPQVLVDGHVDTTFAYIPDHIEYMLYELLNNSIRGVMLKFSPSLKHVSEPPELLQQFQKLERLKSPDISKDPSSIYPPISVTISSGPTDLYFRISDQGGGISDEIYPHIWSFASTPTLNNKFENFVKVPQMAAKVQEYEQSIIPPTLHLGIGLPMSKVYAEYWGGGLTLFTMDGYGTDAYIKISRLGNREENLE